MLSVCVQVWRASCPMTARTTRRRGSRSRLCTMIARFSCRYLLALLRCYVPVLMLVAVLGHDGDQRGRHDAVYQSGAQVGCNGRLPGPFMITDSDHVSYQRAS